MPVLAVCTEPVQPLCLILLHVEITGFHMAGGWEKQCLTSINGKAGLLASVLVLCLEGHCWRERSGLCILAPAWGKQVGLGEGRLASVHCWRGRKPNSAVTAKEQLFKARRKAGVSNTKSLQLTEALSAKHKLITEYSPVKCLLNCRICFQDCKQPASMETNLNLCLLLLYRHKGASEKSWYPLSAMAATLLVWIPPFWGYTGISYVSYFFMLNQPWLCSCRSQGVLPLILVGASASLGLVLVLFVKVLFKLFSKQLWIAFSLACCPPESFACCKIYNHNHLL